MSQDPPSLAQAWLTAARDEHIVAELEGIYAYIAAAIESRGPACWASGRCCNFDAAGHRLYVTGLETAYAVARLTAMSKGNARPSDFPVLSSSTLAAAVQSGGCPFQIKNLCGIHAIKPLGCRVYFCDRSAQRWQEELSEAMLARVRSLHDRHGVEYRYGEWRQMLSAFA